MANILIIDDESGIRAIIARYASEMSCNVAVAESLQTGLKLASKNNFQLIFLDIHLPDGDGLKKLPTFRSLPSQPEVIIITGMDPAEGAEQAIKSGAWDYILKPFTREEIKLNITRALEFQSKKSALDKISLRRDGFISSSREMGKCFDRVAQCAGNDVNVIITGETGVGKELLAQTIHKNSPRAKKSFIVVDCAALPENLMESILCGHRKGAFTGADKEHIGLAKQADGGTLFLDEVGELPLSFQKKFLRILQERRFRPIGSEHEISSDFRLISATNKDLDELEKEGSFRKDLIYRLRTFDIYIPPLRHRRTDIKDLLQHYILKISEKHGVRIKGYTPEFLEFLMSYHWPGNARELINSLEKAILTDPNNPTLYHMHLPMEIRIHHAKQNHPEDKHIEKNHISASMRLPLSEFSLLLDTKPTFKEFKEKVNNISEPQYLKNLMAETGCNIKKACRISQLSQSRLYTLLKKYDIKTK